MNRKAAIRVLQALVLTLFALSACVPSGAAELSGKTSLALVGFAVPKSANAAAQTAFAESSAGRDTVWRESYGASGDQSRAVVSGLPADYVHFSITPDVTRLVDAGLIAETWDDGPHQGIVTKSLVVLVVHAGNPKGIYGWDDLVRDDVEVITPNPRSSGAARWNILAAWQHIIGAGGSETEAREFLSQIFRNVKALPSSGRDATQVFANGTGDVLISYENEAILARQNGETFDYVVPDDTLLIENPAAVMKNAHPKATAFLAFVRTPAGQAAYVSQGFRPLSSAQGTQVGNVAGANDPKNPFPTPKRVATIDEDFGGWDAVNEKFFHEKHGIITELQTRTGLS